MLRTYLNNVIQNYYMQHHDHLVEKLKKKGWSQKELDRVHKVMKQSHSKKTAYHKVLDAAISWVMFIIIILGNIAVLFAVMPTLVLFPNPIIFLILLVLGLAFGFLFELVLSDMDHLFAGHHHVFLYVLIPYLAVTGGIFILNFGMKTLPNVFLIERSALLMSLVYALSFFVPFLLTKLIFRRK